MTVVVGLGIFENAGAVELNVFFRWFSEIFPL